MLDLDPAAIPATASELASRLEAGLQSTLELGLESGLKLGSEAGLQCDELPAVVTAAAYAATHPRRGTAAALMMHLEPADAVRWIWILLVR